LFGWTSRCRWRRRFFFGWFFFGRFNGGLLHRFFLYRFFLHRRFFFYRRFRSLLFHLRLGRGLSLLLAATTG
jgi:hypothetical protein